MRSTCALLFVLMQIAGGAAGQPLNQQQCPGADPDLSISGCTAMIRSGQETQQKLALDYAARGVAYLAKSQRDRAIQDFNQVIRLNPNLTLAYNARGAAYLAKGQPDRAIQDFNQAIRLNPNSAYLAFNNRGAAYLAKGRPDRAIQDFDQAIRLNPSYAQAFYDRGLAKQVKGDAAGGGADMAKARQLSPGAPP